MMLRNLLYFIILNYGFRFCCSEADPESRSFIAQKTNRLFLLHLKYGNMWNEITKINTEETFQTSDGELELSPVDINSLLTYLNDRFLAIQLNIFSWQCAWYYGRKAMCIFWLMNQNCRYSKICAKVAKIMAWYNARFTAQMFINAFQNQDSEAEDKEQVKVPDPEPGLEPSQNEAEIPEKLDYEELAQKTDRVQEKLKILSGMLKKGKFKDENLFQRLEEVSKSSNDDETLNETEKASEVLDDDEQLSKETTEVADDAEPPSEDVSEQLEKVEPPSADPIDFDIHEKIGQTLWNFLGQEYLDIYNYWLAFVNLKYKIKDDSALSETWPVVEKRYKAIHKASRKLKIKYTSVWRILNLEQQMIFARSEVENRDVMKNYKYTAWKAKKVKRGYSDYRMIFT